MQKPVLALCLLVLCGCATGNWREGRRPWWTLTEREFAAITREMPAVDVERILGKPLLVETFANLREKVWDYRFLNHVVGRYAAEVHFDLEGKATYVVTYPDHCPFNAVGCP